MDKTELKCLLHWQATRMQLLEVIESAKETPASMDPEAESEMGSGG